VAAGLPGAHILQTRSWAEAKAEYGWLPLPHTWKDDTGLVKAAALVLERTVSPLKLRILYVPRGPLLDWEDAPLRSHVLDDLEALARNRRAIYIKLDPELVMARWSADAPDRARRPAAAAVLSDLIERGWFFSGDQIQFRNTVQVDLNCPEAERLARLKQKWRYNLRLAERKGVSIRQGGESDLPLLYRMYAETSLRDGFVIRSQEYYLGIWKRFMRQKMATPLLAEVDGDPIAGLILFHFAGKAWYMFGMSLNAHREKMPNHLLQWHAMQTAASLGCQVYDLWGAPDEFVESDPMWGVYRFKDGMGGQVVETLGAWDFVASRWKYSLYTQLMPRLLAILRRRGKAQTKREASL
jgi:lipid II:glycine glycyltransferase (peptidoglycan interpeptide bridge formation enzyme)